MFQLYPLCGDGNPNGHAAIAGARIERRIVALETGCFSRRLAALREPIVPDRLVRSAKFGDMTVMREPRVSLRRKRQLNKSLWDCAKACDFRSADILYAILIGFGRNSD